MSEPRIFRYSKDVAHPLLAGQYAIQTSVLDVRPFFWTPSLPLRDIVLYPYSFLVEVDPDEEASVLYAARLLDGGLGTDEVALAKAHAPWAAQAAELGQVMRLGFENLTTLARVHGHETLRLMSLLAKSDEALLAYFGGAKLAEEIKTKVLTHYRSLLRTAKELSDWNDANLA